MMRRLLWMIPLSAFLGFVSGSATTAILMLLDLV